MKKQKPGQSGINITLKFLSNKESDDVTIKLCFGMQKRTKTAQRKSRINSHNVTFTIHLVQPAPKTISPSFIGFYFSVTFLAIDGKKKPNGAAVA